MKISTKGRYGLRALIDVAVHEDGDPVTLVSVAKRQNLSQNYLEQVFGSLRRAGIVRSVKGMNGGYYLAKNPEEITVKEVLEVLEGQFSIVDRYDKAMETDEVHEAIQSLVWDRINYQVNLLLEGKTLDQLISQSEAMEPA